jgi:substrate import-associated zinc metallohydrolase lipoprotein
MKIRYNLLYLLFITLIYTSCKKEKLSDQSVFVDTTLPKNALDNYIYNNYIVPYNIDILYKYVDRETDLDYNLAPATYDGSVRMTKLLLYLGIQPYDNITGNKTFMKTYFPKLLTYLGTSSIRSNGTIVLGTAEGGRKINLYNLNNLAANSTNISYLNKYYFHVIHHEFQHILNQTKPFPTSFATISGPNYVDDVWNTTYTTDGAAIAAGFISPYASKEATEDFAELYSFYVTLSATEYTAYLNSVGSTPAGIAIIAAKTDIVKAYMKNEFGIDMDLLRANIQSKVAGLPTFDQTTLP